ncbi:MAG TPA: DUF899 domain-containing protein [Polyangiaceae bacterium]|nr:DUF899 domain-containing protein [Polyangiaceae bacterium]
MPSRRPSKKPPRRETMEVDTSWLLDPANVPKLPALPRRVLPPPLPREDAAQIRTPREDPRSDPPASTRPRKSRKPPPPLPQHAARHVVDRAAWIEARRALLVKEKAHTRAKDALSKERRELPWLRVDKRYTFETKDGRATLENLFGKKAQLVVYHFMLPPGKDTGCKHCSFWADNFEGTVTHLAARDVAFVAVSRGSLAKIETFKKRMGWSFDWVSCGERGDFNRDFQGEWYGEGFDDREGISVFYKDELGTIFHTYSAYARGVEPINGAYHVLDMVPKGRDEGDGGPGWVRHHDRYS